MSQTPGAGRVGDSGHQAIHLFGGGVDRRAGPDEAVRMEAEVFDDGRGVEVSVRREHSVAVGEVAGDGFGGDLGHRERERRRAGRAGRRSMEPDRGDRLKSRPHPFEEGGPAVFELRHDDLQSATTRGAGVVGETGQEVDRGGGADDGLVRQRAGLEAFPARVTRASEPGHVEGGEGVCPHDRAHPGGAP